MLLQVLYLLVAVHLAREVQETRTNKRRVTDRGSECQHYIAHSMEAAAAAVPEVGPEEDDRLDAMTVAEPEMEVDVQGSDPEPENADDLPDLDEYPEEVNDNSDDTRQAVLLSGVTLVLETKARDR